jgi:hypothetical protein
MWRRKRKRKRTRKKPQLLLLKFQQHEEVLLWERGG